MRMPVLLPVLALIVACGGDPNAQQVNAKTEKGAVPSAGSDAGSGGPAVDDPEGADESSDDDSPVLARVGDTSVTVAEFQLAAQRVQPKDGAAFTAEEKRDILKELVDKKILWIEARKVGLDEDPKVQKLMVQTLMRKKIYSTVRNADFTEDELRAFFEENREMFVVPEKVQVKRIFIKTENDEAAAKQKASGIRNQVVADPEQFRALAAEHSRDPYRKRGGDMGFVTREGKPGVDPVIVEKAFTLGVGDVSDVFPTDGGFNVIMVANKREETERTFDQMKGSVLRRLKNDRYQTLYDEYVDKVRAEHSVKVDNAAVEGIEVEPRRFGPGRMPAPSLGGR